MTKQEILDYLDNVLHPMVSPDNWNIYSELYDMIEELPSEEPARHGKWIESEIPHELYVCSNCGGACWSYDYERTIVKSNFCPNCGAKMEKGRTMTKEEVIKKINAIKKYLIAGNPIWNIREIDEVLNMAIEALQNEGIGRYEKAMQTLREMPRRLNDIKEKRIKKIPPKTGEWIPVSERLPREDGQYLVYYEGTIIGSCIEIMWYSKPSMPNVDVSGKHFYRSDSEWGDIIYDEVIAWMPLPMPYRKDNE